MQTSANKQGSISCAIQLSRPSDAAKITAKGNKIIITQHLSAGKGVKFEARVIVEVKGGKLSVNGTKISCGKSR